MKVILSVKFRLKLVWGRVLWAGLAKKWKGTRKTILEVVLPSYLLAIKRWCAYGPPGWKKHPIWLTWGQLNRTEGWGARMGSLRPSNKDWRSRKVTIGSNRCYVFLRSGLFWTVMTSSWHHFYDITSYIICIAFDDAILHHIECLSIVFIVLLVYCIISHHMFVFAMPFHNWTLVVYINLRSSCKISSVYYYLCILDSTYSTIYRFLALYYICSLSYYRESRVSHSRRQELPKIVPGCASSSKS